MISWTILWHVSPNTTEFWIFVCLCVFSYFVNCTHKWNIHGVELCYCAHMKISDLVSIIQVDMVTLQCRFRDTASIRSDASTATNVARYPPSQLLVSFIDTARCIYILRRLSGFYFRNWDTWTWVATKLKTASDNIRTLKCQTIKHEIIIIIIYYLQDAQLFDSAYVR